MTNLSHNIRSFRLEQNYPNPFNPTTAIRYQLSEAGHVQLTFCNALGQKVRTLMNKRQGAGSHQLTFDASHLSSGVYYYRLCTSQGFAQPKKMILMR